MIPREVYPHYEFGIDHPLDFFFWDITFNSRNVGSYLRWWEVVDTHSIQSEYELQKRHKKLVKRFNKELR